MIVRNSGNNSFIFKKNKPLNSSFFYLKYLLIFILPSEKKNKPKTEKWRFFFRSRSQYDIKLSNCLSKRKGKIGRIIQSKMPLNNTNSVCVSRISVFPLGLPFMNWSFAWPLLISLLAYPPINTAPNINKSSLWDESKCKAPSICIKSELIWLAMSYERNVRQGFQDVVCLQTEFISSDQNLF